MSPTSSPLTPPRDRNRAEVSTKDVSRIIKMMRPSFKSKGGDVTLVGIKDTSVVIRLSGACGDCPISFSESSGVIERIVRSRMPQINELTVI